MNENWTPKLISENPISGRKNVAFWKVIMRLNNLTVNGIRVNFVKLENSAHPQSRWQIGGVDFAKWKLLQFVAAAGIEAVNCLLHDQKEVDIVIRVGRGLGRVYSSPTSITFTFAYYLLQSRSCVPLRVRFIDFLSKKRARQANNRLR